MTAYKIIAADGTVTEDEIEWPKDPGYDRLRDLVVPLLGNVWLEHVRVLDEGRYKDMFVAEAGHRLKLPRNEKATALYRAGWLKLYPGARPEDLAHIVGPAILFDQQVWF